MKTVLKSKIAIMSVVLLAMFGAIVPANTVMAASGDATVYITKTGECYHLDGCSSLRRSKIATTLQAAVNKGLRPCSNCHPGTLDSSSPAPSSNSNTATKSTPSTAAAAATVAAPATAKADPAVEALKTYKDNTKSFNAYDYYMNNVDLQTAIGADGAALLKHYNKYGKKEGRIAIIASAIDPTVEALKTYKGNTKDFNAYVYYTKNADLQTAIGPDGDALLKHYNEYGKTEKRVAK